MKKKRKNFNRLVNGVLALAMLSGSTTNVLAEEDTSTTSVVVEDEFAVDLTNVDKLGISAEEAPLKVLEYFGLELDEDATEAFGYPVYNAGGPGYYFAYGKLDGATTASLNYYGYPNNKWELYNNLSEVYRVRKVVSKITSGTAKPSGLVKRNNYGANTSNLRKISNAIGVYVKKGINPDISTIVGEYGWEEGINSMRFNAMTITTDENTVVQLDYAGDSDTYTSEKVDFINNLIDTSKTSGDDAEYYYVGGVNGGFFQMSDGTPIGAVRNDSDWYQDPDHNSGYVTSYWNNSSDNDFRLSYDGYDKAEGLSYYSGEKYWGAYPENLETEAVSGAYTLLVDGNVVDLGAEDSANGAAGYKSGNNTGATLVGKNAKGQILLVTVEYNSETDEGSKGLQYEAQLMKSLGATDAIRMDGGGSTVFAYDPGLTDKVPTYNVRFVYDGEEFAGRKTVDDIVASKNIVVNLLSEDDMSIKGYKFNGFTSNDVTINNNSFVMTNHSVEIHYSWTRDESQKLDDPSEPLQAYQITKMYNGTQIEHQSKTAGFEIEISNDGITIPDGYELDGWYLNANRTQKIANNKFTPTENTMVYAWLVKKGETLPEGEVYPSNVTFSSKLLKNDGSWNTLTTSTKAYGTTVELGSSYTNYVWYTDEEMTTPLEDTSKVIMTSDITLYAKADGSASDTKVNKSHSVTFVNVGESDDNLPVIENMTEVVEGTFVNLSDLIKSLENIEGYTFNGFKVVDKDGNKSNLNDKNSFLMQAYDMTVEYSFTKNAAVAEIYTVTWVNDDGTELEKDTDVAKGSMPNYDGATPTKADDDKYTYEFDQWTPELAAVEGNVTYTATFKATEKAKEPGPVANTYTVTWKNYDGTVLETDTVKENDIPEYNGSTPTQDTTLENGVETKYKFSYWSNDDDYGQPVKKNIDFVAQFAKITTGYLIEFTDESGKTLESVNPTSVEDFHNFDTTKYDYLAAKENDAQYEYVFDKWVGKSSGESGVDDRYSLQVKNQKAINGSYASFRTIYSPTYTKIARKYTVKFLSEGTELSSAEYEYNQMPTMPENPTKAEDETNTYSFSGWDKEVVSVTEDATYTAQFDATPKEAEKYTIKFVDYDGTEISSKEYAKGEAIEKPADPTREADDRATYTFKDWTIEVSETAGANATYTARYDETIKSYTVSFVDEDGVEIAEVQTVEYGKVPTMPTVTKPEDDKYTYEFASWDKLVTAVTGDTQYVATFKAIEKSETKPDPKPETTEPEIIEGANQNVVIGNEARFRSSAEFSTFDHVEVDGTTVSSDDYTAVEGSTVVTLKSGFVSGLSTGTHTLGIVSTTGTAATSFTVSAASTPVTVNKYTVTWVDEDGTVLETDNDVEEGTIPSYDGLTPTKAATADARYEFSGWDAQLTGVIADTTFTAVYKEIKIHHVTFTVRTGDENGIKTIPTQLDIEDGQSLKLPELSLSDGWKFKGFESNDGTSYSDGSTVNSDVNFEIQLFPDVVGNDEKGDGVDDRTQDVKTITFAIRSGDEGTISFESKKVVNGETVGKLPEYTSPAGKSEYDHVFALDGQIVDETTLQTMTVTEDMQVEVRAYPDVNNDDIDDRLQSSIKFLLNKDDAEGLALADDSVQYVLKSDTLAEVAKLVTPKDGWVITGYELNNKKMTPAEFESMKLSTDIDDIQSVTVFAMPDTKANNADGEAITGADGIDDRDQILLTYNVRTGDDSGIVSQKYKKHYALAGKLTADDVPELKLVDDWTSLNDDDKYFNVGGKAYNSAEFVTTQPTSDTVIEIQIMPDVLGNGGTDVIDKPDMVDDRLQSVITYTIRKGDEEYINARDNNKSLKTEIPFTKRVVMKSGLAKEDIPVVMNDRGIVALDGNANGAYYWVGDSKNTFADLVGKKFDKDTTIEVRSMPDMIGHEGNAMSSIKADGVDDRTQSVVTYKSYANKKVADVYYHTVINGNKLPDDHSKFAPNELTFVGYSNENGEQIKTDTVINADTTVYAEFGKLTINMKSTVDPSKVVDIDDEIKLDVTVKFEGNAHFDGITLDHEELKKNGFEVVEIKNNPTSKLAFTEHKNSDSNAIEERYEVTLKVSDKHLENNVSGAITASLNGSMEKIDASAEVSYKLGESMLVTYFNSDPYTSTESNDVELSPGDKITYTIHVENTGDGTARYVRVVDAIPAGTLLDGKVNVKVDNKKSEKETIANNDNASVKERTIIVDLTKVRPKSSVDITYTVTVNVGANNSIPYVLNSPRINESKLNDIVKFDAKNELNVKNDNKAYVVIPYALKNGDKYAVVDYDNSAYGNVSGTFEGSVHQLGKANVEAKLGSIPASGTVVTRGSHIGYTITLTNYGNATATYVAVRDVLPEGVKIDPMTVTGGTIKGGEMQNGAYIEGKHYNDDSSVEWVVHHLKPGQSVSIYFEAYASDTFKGTIYNSVSYAAYQRYPGNPGTGSFPRTLRNVTESTTHFTATTTRRIVTRVRRVSGVPNTGTGSNLMLFGGIGVVAIAAIALIIKKKKK